MNILVLGGSGLHIDSATTVRKRDGELVVTDGPFAETKELIAGYWIGSLAQGAYGTAFGALSTEVFPTSHRGTAQGWLAAAGVAGAVAGLLLFGVVNLNVAR